MKSYDTSPRVHCKELRVLRYFSPSPFFKPLQKFFLPRFETAGPDLARLLLRGKESLQWLRSSRPELEERKENSLLLTWGNNGNFFFLGGIVSNRRIGVFWFQSYLASFFDDNKEQVRIKTSELGEQNIFNGNIGKIFH